MLAQITVQKTNVTIVTVNENDYISLTDIAKYKSEEPATVIGNWMRNRNTIEYLGLWENLYNPKFNPIEFEGFKKDAGLNAFTLSFEYGKSECYIYRGRVISTRTFDKT